MESGAYQQLEAFGLPHPPTITLEEAVADPSADNFYYLRFNTPGTYPSVLSSLEMANQERELWHLRTSGRLLQIEPLVVSQAGGCAFANDGEIYAELVIGHLSGLLLNGRCQLRLMISPSDTYILRRMRQSMMVAQSPPKMLDQQALSLETPVLFGLTCRALELLPRLPPKTLLEFIITDSGVVYFVDIKPHPWDLRYKRLFADSGSQEPVYTRPLFAGDCPSKEADSPNIYQGSLDLKLLDRVTSNTIIKLGDHALLSHFVTYSLRRGIPAVVL